MTVVAVFVIGICLVLAYGVVRGLGRSINLKAFSELGKPPGERSFKLPSEEAEEREKRAKPLL